MGSTTTAREDLRQHTDAGLQRMYASADETTCRAILAECARRDRADKAARTREAIRGEWYDAMFAQYLAAEAECRGNLLSKEGLASGLADPSSLWSGPRDQAMRYASEELRDFWLANPRMTITEYERQRAAATRIARAEWHDTTTTDTEGTSGDEQHDHGPVLARDEPGALRREPTPAQAPQAGTGRLVRRGRRRTVILPARQSVGAGARRSGGPIRQLERTGLNGRMLGLAYV
jgi:hypothetical protein